MPTPRDFLVSACDRVGVRHPEPRRRRDTWIRRAIGRYRAEDLDGLWLDRARAYLEAAWTASRRRDGETCERMLHGAVTMLRLGDAWEYYDASPVSEHDPDLRGLGYVDRHVPAELSIRRATPERTLVFYLMKDQGPVVGEESWTEGFGLAHDAYMLDDGVYREAFADEWDAGAAAREWARRPRRGRGLPYLDTEERREARAQEARDPQTSEARMFELMHDPADEVLVALAENPAAPGWVELELSEYADIEILGALAHRRDLLDVTIRRMLALGHPDLAATALTKGNLSFELEDELANNQELVQVLCSGYELDDLPDRALRIIAENWSLWAGDEVEAILASRARGGTGGQPTGRILRRTYTIDRWTRWDDELHACATEFHERFGVYPNILLAHEVTFARIDMAARKGKILADDGTEAAEGEHTPLSSFVGPDYELDFALDDALEVGDVSLIHDTDPDGGGEPVPEEDTPVAVVGAEATGTGG